VNKASKAYAQRFALAMIGYTVLLILSLLLLREEVSLPVRIGIALLPVLPILFGLGAFMAFLRSMDEMQRQIQFQAFGFSLLATAVTSLTLGFLGIADVPVPGLMWVFPMIVAYWGIGQWVAGRDYL
jgi:hypothetical protein